MVDTLKMQALCEIAKEAGNQILEVYESDFDVETKEDQSPLTLADKKSHQVIVEGLKALDPNVPPFCQIYPLIVSFGKTNIFFIANQS